MPRKPVERPVRYGLCPNGYFVIVPIVLALVSMTLTFFGTLTCEFFTIHEYGTPLRGVGLWHIEKLSYIKGELDYDEWRCEILDKDMVDENLKVARALSFFAVMFGLVACFTTLTFCCCGIKESRLRLIYKTLCILFLFIGFCMAMTGIALNSSLCQDAEYCEWSWGASLCIMSAIIWNVSGFTFCCCTPIKQKERRMRKGKKNGNDSSKHGADHEAQLDEANDEENPSPYLEDGDSPNDSDSESEDDDREGNAYETESTVDILNTHEDTNDEDDEDEDEGSFSDEESSYEHRNKRFRTSIDPQSTAPAIDYYESDDDDDESANSHPDVESSSDSDDEFDGFDEEEDGEDDYSEANHQVVDEQINRDSKDENIDVQAIVSTLSPQPANSVLARDDSVKEDEISSDKKKRGFFKLFGRKKSSDELDKASLTNVAEDDKPAETAVKRVSIVEPAGVDPDEQATSKDGLLSIARKETKATPENKDKGTNAEKEAKDQMASSKRKSKGPRDPPAVGEAEMDSVSDSERPASPTSDDDHSSVQSGYSA